MASAQSLNELLDFETSWDALLASVLSVLPFPIHPLQEDESLDPPYIAASFSFGGEHMMPGGSQANQRGTVAARWDPVSYKGAVDVEIVVSRPWLAESTVNVSKLTEARGGVRRLFLPSAAAFNSASSPWYGIASVEFGPAERSVDLDRDLDITSMRIDLVWFVRPEAWPIS